MAAENMANIVKGYLTLQKRPRYLQPMTADGRFPWEEKEEARSTSFARGTSNASSGSDMASTSSSVPSRCRKRRPQSDGAELKKKVKEF